MYPLTGNPRNNPHASRPHEGTISLGIIGGLLEVV